MKSIIKTSFLMTITLIIVCGFIYPLLVTGASQLFFNEEANGSLIEFNGKIVGSKLIGQDFEDERFFQGRVSAVSYNTYAKEDNLKDENGKKIFSGVASGSDNLAPSNTALKERVSKDIEEFLKNNLNINKEDIPADLVTSSGSGLDPHITPESAKIQLDRVSKASGIAISDLEKIIEKYTEGRSLGIFGEPRVNVLLVNLEIATILKNNGKL
ncbi:MULTISPECIES: potassium-transporting ATPase subunit KdpC [unclassified Clostridium]|uniref:potassium-transporting ATPase subunit KdpC n=1 Tax=unclassified Clostridium TaxID=2614128 RepID=UPI0025C37B38|nr:MULTISPECIES: potassium-transporting ATPase subunit KdpC [unclassified Clostridium]